MNKFGTLPSFLKSRAVVAVTGDRTIYICGGNDGDFTPYSEVLTGKVVPWKIENGSIACRYSVLYNEVCFVKVNHDFISVSSAVRNDIFNFVFRCDDARTSFKRND